MSAYFYGPALDTEVDYRRDSLRREADEARLARRIRKPHRPGFHLTRRTTH